MRLNFSIAQKLTLSFSIMVLLVLIASGIGVWYATTIRQAVDAAQQGITQTEHVADLQFSWAAVAANVDNMLLTRQVSLTEQVLAEQLEEFNHQLKTLGSLPMGQTPQAMAENQQTMDTLNLLSSELNQVVTKLVALSKSRRWATAQALRHTELISFQRRFNEGLDELRLSSRAEMEESVAQAVEAQQQARTLWIVTIAMAVGFGLISAMLATQSITRPVNTLTKQAQRVAQRDFSPVVPLTQSDEIGELSRTFALMTDWLRESYQMLEQRVEERTRRLEFIATLSERVNTILNPDDLLYQVIDQIQENFQYYHAHIYILSPDNRKWMVAAGAGPAGAEMKAKGHSISIDAPSLVARAARTQQVVWVDDVHQTPDWLPNPLLPDTRSEMAVPIIIDGQVVGVLDVQENAVSGFDEGDANLLRSLANQVAVAIRNARLFQETDAALNSARITQERYTTQSWSTARLKSGGQRYHFSRPNARPQADDQPSPPQKPVIAPVLVGNQQIGAVQVYPDEKSQNWSEDDHAILAAVADELGQIAENLRLFEETQERASREQLLGQISDKLRRAPDMETLLKVGVDEIARLLGPARTFVKLGPPIPETTTPELNKKPAAQPNGAVNGRGDKQL